MPLAQHIASYDQPPVQVPSLFLKTATRAIQARQKSNAYYNTLESVHGEPDGHLHFVGILKSVLDVLKPRMSKSANYPDVSTSSKNVPEPAASDSITMENLFAGLEVDDHDEVPVSQEASTADSSQWLPATLTKPQPPKKYELEPMKEQENLRFAIYWLFTDVNKFLQFVKHLWTGYAEGEQELIAVSVTINTAIDLVRRLEGEFSDNFPQVKGVQDIIKTCYMTRCAMKGQDPKLNSDQQGDAFNFECYDEATWVFLPNWLILEAFSDVVEPGSVPLFKPGHFGTYDPRSDRPSKSAEARFLEDKILLCEVLPQFAFLAEIGASVLGEDELTRGLKDFMRNKKMSLWLLFGVQCFLEAHHTLRDRVSRAFSELKLFAHGVKATAEENFEFHKTLRIDNWPVTNDHAMRQALITRVDQLIVKDRIHATLQKSARGKPVPEPFFLFRNHPIFCGTALFALQIQAQELGQTFVNAWGSVMYTAHLYNAVYQEDACGLWWPEMEAVIDLHGADRLFVGGRPTTKKDYLTRFLLCMAYSAASLQQQQGRQTNLKASRNGPRGLREVSPVCQLFKRRFTENAGRLDINLEQVESLLNEMFEGVKAATQAEGEDQALQVDVNVQQKSAKTKAAKAQRQQNKAKATTAGKKLRKKIIQAKRLTPLELLLTLQGSITIELTELEFDYFNFHRKCWMLLREVQSALHQSLLKYLDPGYLETESQLPFVVGYIFGTAHNSDRFVREMLHMKPGESTSKLLQEAGTVVETFIRQEVHEDTETIFSAMETSEFMERARVASLVTPPQTQSPPSDLPRDPANLGIRGIDNIDDLLEAARQNGLGNFEVTEEGRRAFDETASF